MVEKVPCASIEDLLDPSGRLAKQFWKLFHALHNVLLDLMSLATERCGQEWNGMKTTDVVLENLCLASTSRSLVTCLFRVQGVSHVICSICSNLSEVLHR